MICDWDIHVPSSSTPWLPLTGPGLRRIFGNGGAAEVSAVADQDPQLSAVFVDGIGLLRHHAVTSGIHGVTEEQQMAQRFYKTTARRRELSNNTRGTRRSAGMPAQPHIVDEALSAALQAASTRNVRAAKTGRPVPEAEARVIDRLLAAALDHLVDIRGLNRERCFTALQQRLFKRRRYTGIPPEKP